MLEVHFDTMSAVHRMRDAGFNEKQAEAMTIMVRDAISSGVATKTDVVELKAEIDSVRAEIEILRSDMTGEIATLRAELKAEIDSVRAEIEIFRAETKAEFEKLHTEMRTNIRWMMVIGGFIAIAVAEPIVARYFT